LLRDLLLACLRRRRLILTAYALTLAACLVWIFTKPPTYRAAAKILLTANRAATSASAEQPAELIRTSQISSSELASQLEVLQSRALVERAVMELDAEKPASSDDREQGNVANVAKLVFSFPKDVLRTVYRRFHGLTDVGPTSPVHEHVTRALKFLEVTRLRDSNIVEVAFTGSDPVRARDFVNRLTAAYLEWYAEMQRIGEAETFFTNQSEVLRRKLVASEEALQKLREEDAASAGKSEELQRRLSELSAELGQTKIARAEQEGRLAYLEQLQTSAGTDGRVATPQLLDLEARRAELAGRYRLGSVRVQEIDQQIRTLRAAIASYDTIAASTDPTSPGAATDVISARAALAALRAREKALASEHDEYGRKAGLAETRSFELGRLERQVSLDEETYLSYVRAIEQARLANAVQQSKILRLTVIEPASLPVEASGPSRQRMLTFALFGGFVLSLSLGVARDYLDTTVKSANDVRRYGSLEVLAVLPDRA